MVDREKVLFALDCYAEQRETCGDRCPYFTRIAIGFGGHGYGYCAKANIAKDAIALLKEQEPVVATWYQVDGIFGLEDGYKCGECNAEIAPQMRYCPYCGRKVDWNVLSRILQEAGQKPLAGLQAQAQINTGEQEDYEPDDKTEEKAGGKRDD